MQTFGQPEGLAATWSARAKGADHRKNGRRELHLEEVPEASTPPTLKQNQPNPARTTRATALASLEDAIPLTSLNRWSFPPLPRTTHRLPSVNPSGWAEVQNPPTSYQLQLAIAPFAAGNSPSPLPKGREFAEQNLSRFEPLNHREGTSNIQHPTSNVQGPSFGPLLDVERSMLDVGCSPGSGGGQG